MSIPPCAGMHADDWFPDRKQRDWRDTANRAISVCRSCPLRVSCAVQALERGEHEGIWAGVLMMPKVTARKDELNALYRVVGDPARLAKLHGCSA